MGNRFKDLGGQKEPGLLKPWNLEAPEWGGVPTSSSPSSPLAAPSDWFLHAYSPSLESILSSSSQAGANADLSLSQAIPPDFCKHIAPYLHRRVLLRGPGGNTWSVKVERDECSGDVFFHGGWNQFVSDHGLKTGDFLVFEHSGSPNFTVLIFDTSFCEKAALQALPRDESTVTESRLGPRISPRRKVTKMEKARALESASSFLSKRPFAICVMRDFHVHRCYFLDLPRALVKHLPRKSMAMRLRVPSGEAWKVAYVYCEGRGGFSSGWGLFAAAHNLERDDVVVFELVRPLEFWVYIHRVVEE